MQKQITYLKDYTVSNFLIKNVYLAFHLEEEYALVKSTISFYKNPESNADNTLMLHWEELELVSVMLDGKKLSDQEYNIADDKLVLKNMPDSFELEITTKNKPQENTQLMWLYKSSGIFCTQCESEGFRRITYFLDRPDVLTLFTVKIIADKAKYPLLLSNGNTIDSGDLEDNKHFVVWEDPFKKPCYLFALVAGDLEYLEDTFITMSGKKAVIRVFSTENNISKIPFSIECIKKSMKWDEERFWREYDLDMFMVVAVDDFNSGAMENKGLNIFNSSCIFATPDTATDRDFVRVEKVIGHEYFHNWTGDRVTCRDWFQLSLKEWLTVYRDHEFTSDMRDRWVARIEWVKLLKNYQFKEDSSPMAHPIRPQAFEEISNFYTATVYEKGSEIIRIYEQILGKDGFRAWMDLYFERHDGEAVTTEDFLFSMRDANTEILEKKWVDLTQMQAWYDQAWTPTLKIETNYNTEAKELEINFSQTCPDTPETAAGEKKPFLIPIAYSIFEKDSKKEISNRTQVLSSSEMSMTVSNVESEPICSFLKWFSAPVKLDYTYSAEDLEFLVKHDSDEFIQYECFAEYAKKLILQEYSKQVWNPDNSSDYMLENFLALFKHVLIWDNYSNSLKTEILELPGEQDLVETIGGNIHHDIVHAARNTLQNAICESLEENFQFIYHTLAAKSDYNGEEYDLSNEAIGRRKLQNLVLFYYTLASQNSEAAYKQFRSASCMTLEMWALNALMQVENTQKTQALKEFYEKWKDDSVVIDKWFAIQARQPREDILSVLETLEKDELFTMKNPNKVRSVYSAFANLNLAWFNQKSWAWYKLLANKVLEIDALNPMMASRLAKSLISYDTLEPIRRNLLKKELEQLSKAENLSPDLAEVVKKGLM